MFDEPTTVTNEEGLFDDFVDESSDTPQEEEVTTEDENNEAETVEEEASKPFLEIKYNHETRGLSQEEARELAQKGMNYDRFYGDLNELATMNGMTVSDYINSLRDTQTRFEINKEVRALQKQYPNADKEMLEELATRRINESQSKRVKEAQESQKREDDDMRKEMERQLDVFERHYPNVDAQNLDPKVIDYMAQGYTLLEAYTIWNDAQKDTPQAKVSRKNEENRKRSMGNTSNVGSIEADDFMKGFLNG